MKHYREAQGWSQGELARRLGVSRQTINAVETDKYDPSLPLALRMARKSRQIIKQNIVLSLVLKLAFLGLAIPGIATLWMAVLADVGATLLVTLNGMRLLREK